MINNFNNTIDIQENQGDNFALLNLIIKEVQVKLEKQIQLGEHLIVDLSSCNQELLLNSKGS